MAIQKKIVRDIMDSWMQIQSVKIGTRRWADAPCEIDSLFFQTSAKALQNLDHMDSTQLSSMDNFMIAHVDM
jgi:hypothetical protein